jgi:hypothetical protein
LSPATACQLLYRWLVQTKLGGFARHIVDT